MHKNNANFSNSIGAGCMLMNLSHWEKSKLFLQRPSGARTSSNVIQVSFPLRWCDISNIQSLVPTYMLANGQSSIELRIFLENANKFLIAGLFTEPVDATPALIPNTGFSNVFTPASNLKYVLDNVRLNYDVVQTSDAYSSSLRSYLASNQLTLPIDTYYTTQFDIKSDASGWMNFTISTQMSDISAVYIGFCVADEQSSYAYASTDRFVKPHGLEEARLQINGKPYPNVNIRLSGNAELPEAEAYQYLMKALRQNCSLEVIGNANSKNFITRRCRINNIQDVSAIKPLVAGNASNPPTQAQVNAIRDAAAALTVKDIESGSGLYYGVNKCAIVPSSRLNYNGNDLNYYSEDAYLWESPSKFILGFDISKSNYNNEYELSGQDLTKSSGLIQVNLRFASGGPRLYTYNADNSAPALVSNNLQAIVVVKHKRIIEIVFDRSQVIY